MSIEYDYRLAREDVAPRNTYQVPSFTEYNGIPVEGVLSGIWTGQRFSPALWLTGCRFRLLGTITVL